jgi:predicted amino acid racemase
MILAVSEITSNSEDLSSFCESYGIKNSKMVKQLLKVIFREKTLEFFGHSMNLQIKLRSVQSLKVKVVMEK